MDRVTEKIDLGTGTDSSRGGGPFSDEAFSRAAAIDQILLDFLTR
jgi:hypothetical protein